MGRCRRRYRLTLPARMLLDRDGCGDRDKAIGFLRDAVDGYTRLRMPRHAEMARAAAFER